MVIEVMNWPFILEALQNRNALWMAVALVLCAGGCSKLLRRRTAETHKRGVLLADGASSQRRSARRMRVGIRIADFGRHRHPRRR